MFCLDISKTYSAFEATILVGSLQFKNAAGTGVGGFDSCTDTTYFTKNYLKIILKNLTENFADPSSKSLIRPYIKNVGILVDTLGVISDD